MSKKRCSRCGKVYPSSYRSCPYCSGRSGGRRSQPDNILEQIIAILRQHGERIFLVSTAVFLLIAIFGVILTRCSSGKDPKPADDAEPQQQPGEVQEPESQPEPLAISQTAISIYVGETATLTVSGGDGAPVWASSDSEVLSVSGGVVTAKATGAATVTASCGLEKVSCAVTVTEKAPDVEVYLNRKDFTIRPNDPPTFQMKVKVKETKKDYEGAVVWSSADTNVVTISETGLVEKVGRGNTTVTATMGGKVLECIVRVS